MDKRTFEVLINSVKETEHLEFKSAKSQFSFEKTCEYCIALANEGGGILILGVSDTLPRKVLGTDAFLDISKLEKDLFDKIKRRVNIIEFNYNDKRILIVEIPSRPIGEPLQYKGKYLMRVKDRLESMTPDQMKKILNEGINDYSSKVFKDAKVSELSKKAIDELRKLLNQSNRVSIKIDTLTDEQLLRDLGLITDEGVTIAALVLLGDEKVLSSFLPHAEISAYSGESGHSFRFNPAT